MKKILVTGFQPFGGETMNPAWEAVRRLPDTIAGASVTKVEIPVVFGKGPEAVDKAIDEVEPDLVLCVGQAGGRCEDHAGVCRHQLRRCPHPGQRRQPARGREDSQPDGPDAYFVTLPVKAMVQAMTEAGIPAEVSYTAGTYVCNDVMYSLLHTLATKHPGVRGGFLHVPYATEQACHLPSATPSMSLDMMARGIELGLAAAVEHTDDVKAATGTTH
jgi:pyroglutamyl-peptidase